jgi:hypothetical protein
LKIPNPSGGNWRGLCTSFEAVDQPRGWRTAHAGHEMGPNYGNGVEYFGTTVCGHTVDARVVVLRVSDWGHVTVYHITTISL